MFYIIAAVLIILLISGGLWLWYEMKNAPIGYQDEETETFYYGKEEK